MSVRYLMRRRLFSLAGDFVVKDEAGQDHFIVDAKIFSLGHQLVFRDLAGNELLTIHQRLFSFLPDYEITRAGEEVAEVRQKLSFFREQFTVDIPGPDDLTVQGDFWDHEYAFVGADGQPVAYVSKQWFSFTDTYGVETLPGADDVLILACSVVIDLINEDREHH